MVSWSRAEDSEEVRHVIDSTGKVDFLKKNKLFKFLLLALRLETYLMC